MSGKNILAEDRQVYNDPDNRLRELPIRLKFPLLSVLALTLLSTLCPSAAMLEKGTSLKALGRNSEADVAFVDAAESACCWTITEDFCEVEGGL